jgi:hypothetical protein
VFDCGVRIHGCMVDNEESIVLYPRRDMCVIYSEIKLFLLRCDWWILSAPRPLESRLFGSKKCHDASVSLRLRATRHASDEKRRRVVRATHRRPRNRGACYSS